MATNDQVKRPDDEAQRPQDPALGSMSLGDLITLFEQDRANAAAKLELVSRALKMPRAYGRGIGTMDNPDLQRALRVLAVPGRSEDDQLNNLRSLQARLQSGADPEVPTFNSVLPHYYFMSEGSHSWPDSPGAAREYHELQQRQQEYGNFMGEDGAGAILLEAARQGPEAFHGKIAERAEIRERQSQARTGLRKLFDKIAAAFSQEDGFTDLFGERVHPDNVGPICSAMIRMLVEEGSPESIASAMELRRLFHEHEISQRCRKIGEDFYSNPHTTGYGPFQEDDWRRWEYTYRDVEQMTQPFHPKEVKKA